MAIHGESKLSIWMLKKGYLTKTYQSGPHQSFVHYFGYDVFFKIKA